MLKRISFLWFILSCFQAINAQNYFTTKQLNVEQNQDFDIEITVNSDTHIGGFQFDINFNDAYLNFNEKAAISLIETYEVNYSFINNQTIRVVGYTTISQNIALSDRPIVALKMRSLDNPGEIIPVVSNFTVSDIKGNEIEMDFSVNSISILGPKFYLDTQGINFGKLTINQNYNTSFRVYNQGNLPLEISTIELPEGVNSDTNFPLNISGGDSKNIAFSVDTSEELIVDGYISFETNDDNESRAAQSVRVQGEVFSKNELYLTGSDGIRGEPSLIDLNLNNQKSCFGIQFDLVLPIDFTLNTQNINPSDRLDAHSYSVKNIGNNTYRFLIYSMSNAAIKYNAGILLSFEIVPNSEDGTHHIEMQNAVATGEDRQNILSHYHGLNFYVRTPRLNIQNNYIDLGEIPSKKEKGFTINLHNPSSLSLKIDSIAHTQKHIKFSDANTPLLIMPYTSKSIYGSYTSDVLGSFNDTIKIYHNGRKRTDNVFLTGNITAQNYIYFDDLELLNDLTDTLRIKLNNDVPLRGIQFDMSVDQKLKIHYDKVHSAPELDNFTITTATLNNGKQRFLIYSTQKETIIEGNQTILSIPINGNDVPSESTYDVYCDNIYLSNNDNDYVHTNTSAVGKISVVKETSPVVVSQKIQLKEDESVTFELIATDKDGDELSFLVPENTTQGGRVLLEDNKITYTPKSDFFGIDEFTYTVTDGKNNISDKIKLEVNAINDPPTISDFSLNVKQNEEAQLKLSSNDVDNTETEILYELIKGSSFGVSEIKNDTLYYKPKNSFYGNDEITFRCFDGNDYSNEANVLVSVTKTNNTTPKGSNLEVTTNQDQKTSIVLIGYDQEGDEISYSYTSPQHGTILETEQSNVLVYTPDANYFGTDSFMYTVADDNTTSSSNEVSILIYKNINLAPTLAPVNFITTINTSVSIELNGNDPEDESLNYSISKQGNNGNASLLDNKLKYTPNEGYTGSDTVEVIVTDGVKSSDPTELTVTVIEADNTPPVGITNTYVLYNNTFLEIFLEAYDSDEDEVTFKLVEGATHGSLTEIIDNTVKYSPKADFSGNDAFTIVANDTKSNSTPFEITLKVLPIENTKPTAISYTLTTEIKPEIEVFLYGLDSDDNDKQNLIFKDILVQNGAIVEHSRNKIKIVPESNSPLEIRYKVNDLKESSEEAIIHVNFEEN